MAEFIKFRLPKGAGSIYINKSQIVSFYQVERQTCAIVTIVQPYSVDYTIEQVASKLGVSAPSTSPANES